MNKLTLEQRINRALTIAETWGLDGVVYLCIRQGMSPEEALREWDL